MEALGYMVCYGLQGAASGARRTGAGRASGVSFATKSSLGLVIILKGFKPEGNRIRLVP